MQKQRNIFEKLSEVEIRNLVLGQTSLNDSINVAVGVKINHVFDEGRWNQIEGAFIEKTDEKMGRILCDGLVLLVLLVVFENL